MLFQNMNNAHTSSLRKHISCVTITFSLLLNIHSFSQSVIKEFNQDSISIYLANAVGLRNKITPSEYENPIRIALMYFPELENIKIKIQTKNQASPLSARPVIFDIFRKASKRKYIISISNKTSSKFSTIMLKNLSFNSQIGVIGHELSHISDYNKRKGLYFVKLFFIHLSQKKMDNFEYNTDMRCIEHGLGYQLLSWSEEVRFKINLIQWKGIKQMNEKGRERYMNPESIIKEIKENRIYH